MFSVAMSLFPFCLFISFFFFSILKDCFKDKHLESVFSLCKASFQSFAKFPGSILIVDICFQHMSLQKMRGQSDPPLQATQRDRSNQVRWSGPGCSNGCLNERLGTRQGMGIRALSPAGFGWQSHLGEWPHLQCGCSRGCPEQGPR